MATAQAVAAMAVALDGEIGINRHYRLSAAGRHMRFSNFDYLHPFSGFLAAFIHRQSLIYKLWITLWTDYFIKR
ncbi:hypothetical protein ACO0LO_07900 [Undibacterium sp. TJN25]|uniref:hypothetical protein n=1 Tax=Undibacterium sp. TJN25 TaxID=3413056 RepID=UPI003BF2EF0D